MRLFVRDLEGATLSVEADGTVAALKARCDQICSGFRVAARGVSI